MANNITVNTGTVTSKAAELKTLNSSFKSQVENLVSTESSLNSMWEGESRETFHREFQKDITQMNTFHQTIEKYISGLEEIVKMYEKAENANISTASARNH